MGALPSQHAKRKQHAAGVAAALAGLAAINGILAKELPAAKEIISPVPALPDLGEMGVDGIGNFGGDLYAETNEALRRSDGYGRAGTLSWGWWETISRTNPFVAMALDFILAPIRDARVGVTPADESKLAQQQADFVRWSLLENLEPGWPDLLQQTARGFLSTGFSLHELVWGAVAHESLPGGSGLGVVELAERLPSTVADNAWQENSQTHQLERIRQRGPKGANWLEVDLPVEKCWLNTWNRNGKNYAGFSAFRPVQYHCRIQEQLLKLTGIALVREGAGIPVAFTKTEAKLSTDQRRSLIKLLANLVYHENASVVMPAGWELEWIYSPGANKGHVIDAYEALGRHVLMQVGAQQLALGTGSTGSRSVGEVHSTEAEKTVQGVIATIEAGFNGVGRRPYTGICRKLVDANWGRPKSGKYPRLAIILKKPKLSPVEKADAITKFKAAGVFTPTLADENACREDVGLPPIDEETREAEKAKARALLPAQPPPFAEPAQAALLASAKPFVPRRPLRASERALDLQAISELFDSAREKFADGARPLVAEMLMRSLPDVKLAMADGDPSEVANVVLDTERLEAFVGKFLDGLRAEGYRHVDGEKQRGVVTAAAEEEDDKEPQTSADPDAHEEAAAALVPLRKRLVRGMANRLLLDVEREADNVIRTGGAPEEVVARTLERQVTGGGFKGDAGLVVTRAFAVGRDEFGAEHADQVEACELSAILDKDTCGPCERLDGTEFDFGSDEDLELTPPLSSICDGGDACRCLKIFRFRRGAA